MRRMKKLWDRRVKESLALVMVGDGLLAAAGPVRHCMLWQRGPSGWRRMVAFFAERPALTRAVGLAEAGTGLWLASRQWTPMRRGSWTRPLP